MADLQHLVEELSKLTVLEAAELSKKLEEAWGVCEQAAARTQQSASERTRKAVFTGTP